MERAQLLLLVHATTCFTIKMAAHSAVLSMSKIINPFWGGRLGNTVKVRQHTPLLSRRLWSLLCGSVLKYIILSQRKVMWLLSYR